jgi:hypothetical protein
MERGRISMNSNRIFVELVNIKFEINKSMPEGNSHRAAERKELQHFSHFNLLYASNDCIDILKRCR